jgi:hypothetical protein
MITNVTDTTNATSTSETSFARQQNSTAANTTLTVNQDQTRLTKPAMVNPYRPPRKSTNATSIVPVPKLPEDVISPNEVTAEEWHTLGIQYDPPNTNTDLFDNIDPTVLAELEEEEQENKIKTDRELAEKELIKLKNEKSILIFYSIFYHSYLCSSPRRNGNRSRKYWLFI